MYALIWRRLPGPLPVRVGLAAALAAAVVLLLFTVVFPRVEALLPAADVTVTGLATGTVAGLVSP